MVLYRKNYWLPRQPNVTAPALTSLTSPFSLSRPTIREYLSLLEQIFLIKQLPPWHNNHLSRLIKTPKMHLADTLVQAHQGCA
jgi:predicted AAA+ superfamily ATPase